MRLVIGWTVFVGVLWAVAVVGAQIAEAANPTIPGIATVLPWLKVIGAALGSFISPILQLALILFILIAAAKHAGFQLPESLTKLRDWSTMNNVQALIAIIIVAAVCIAALGGLKEVGVLKDLALVVVGFYFGSRRRPHDPGLEEMFEEPPPLASGGLSAGQGKAISPIRRGRRARGP